MDEEEEGTVVDVVSRVSKSKIADDCEVNAEEGAPDVDAKISAVVADVGGMKERATSPGVRKAYLLWDLPIGLFFPITLLPSSLEVNSRSHAVDSTYHVAVEVYFVAS